MLLTRLKLEFRAEGPFEEFLVVQISECIWKFRRANLAEKGAVRTAVWEAKPPNLDSSIESLSQLLAVLKKA